MSKNVYFTIRKFSHIFYSIEAQWGYVEEQKMNCIKGSSVNFL
jgi:hypothetical protein